MRTIFIVNPAAGKRGRALRLLPEIQAYFTAHPEQGDFKCRITGAPGQAADIAREETETGGPVRIIACGGDGTLMETASGIFGRDNVQLGCIPCGSANDYVRSFAAAGDFCNLDALLNGQARRVDAIRCGERISLNLCSMGMDADVADKMTRFKSLPLVSGPMAYQLAIGYVFCHRIGKNLQVVMDTPEGPVEESGRFFFALAANGQYYGGGYRGAPEAMPDDGLLDFVLIKAMPRAKIPGFLSRYKAGRHLDMEVCTHYRGTRMQVHCGESAVVNVDGECFHDTDVEFTLLPGAYAFIHPRKEAAD